MERWIEVDRYIAERLLPPDPALDETLRASALAGLPQHDVSPLQGALLELLARIQGARTILEIGTLGGYSTIWLARALPPAGAWSRSRPTRRTPTSRAPTSRAPASPSVVEVRDRPRARHAAAAARPVRPDLHRRRQAQQSGRTSTMRSHSRSPGTLIVADNVVRDGAVADAASDDPSVQGVRAFFDRLAAEPRLRATAIQTVGVKGYDGFALALVDAD